MIRFATIVLERQRAGGSVKQADPAPWGLMALMALFLLTYPWLSLFNVRAMVLGVPLILLYLFGLWGLLILASALFRPKG